MFAEMNKMPLQIYQSSLLKEKFQEENTFKTLKNVWGLHFYLRKHSHCWASLNDFSGTGHNSVFLDNFTDLSH